MHYWPVGNMIWGADLGWYLSESCEAVKIVKVQTGWDVVCRPKAEQRVGHENKLGLCSLMTVC